MVDLVGGADVYGVKDDLNSLDSFFADVVSGAPAGAIAAIFNKNIGSSNDDYFNQNSIFFVNLTFASLTNPEWGFTTDSDGSFQEPLLTRGFSENPLFGGDGPDTLAALAPGAIYSTLIPDVGGYRVNASANGISLSNQFIDSNGTIVYLVPRLAGDFDEDGDVDGNDFLVWQRGGSPDPLSGADLAEWQSAYDVPPLSTNSAAVPEPAAILLFAIALPALLTTRCRQQQRTV